MTTTDFTPTPNFIRNIIAEDLKAEQQEEDEAERQRQIEDYETRADIDNRNIPPAQGNE